MSVHLLDRHVTISFLLQTSVLDLKEKASSLASSTLKKDNRLKSLEIGLEQKREECLKLENQLKKVSFNTLTSPEQSDIFVQIDHHDG